MNLLLFVDLPCGLFVLFSLVGCFAVVTCTWVCFSLLVD